MPLPWLDNNGQNNGRYRHGMSSHPFYGVWKTMKSRCLNPNSSNYSKYGARGIGVCDRWLVFENFRDDMFAAYAAGLSIDRIDNDGDYCPENCQWVTDKDQANNRRPARGRHLPRPKHSEAMKLSWAQRKVAN